MGCPRLRGLAQGSVWGRGDLHGNQPITAGAGLGWRGLIDPPGEAPPPHGRLLSGGPSEAGKGGSAPAAVLVRVGCPHLPAASCSPHLSDSQKRGENENLKRSAVRR